VKAQPGTTFLAFYDSFFTILDILFSRAVLFPLEYLYDFSERQRVMTTIDRETVVAPANFVPGPKQGDWTYKEYAALPDDGRRYEIMDGVLLTIPSPGPGHQSVDMALSFYLCQHVNMAGLGEAFSAPFDVELAPKRVFQPDLLVLLNRSLGKVTTTRVVGAPDLVIEIASPGTVAYDRLSKYQAYAQAGVEEYWMVDTETRSVEVLTLQAGVYQSQGIFQGKDTLFSQVVPGMRSVRVEQLFQV
jgi:Uma2 family endonuclease